MSDTQQEWYFDLGETTETVRDADADEPFRPSRKLATREDVDAGRSGHHFDYIVGENGGFLTLSGIEAFTQDIVFEFLDVNDNFSPRDVDEVDMTGLEREFERLVSDHDQVIEVDDVTVRHSDREYEAEIEVTMTIGTNYARYTSGFFVGDPTAVQAPE